MLLASQLARYVAAARATCVPLSQARFSRVNVFPSFSDFKDCLNTVYSAIEEADFLAIDGEFSGNHIKVLNGV